MSSELISPQLSSAHVGLVQATLTHPSRHPTNWRRITIAALLLASKVWEDLAVHNRDMLRVFSQLKLKDVMELEHAFLEHLKFTVSLKASVYDLNPD